MVSDAKPTETDVTQYISATKAVRKNVLSKRDATRLRKQQDELVNNYVYTTEDIENNLKNRKSKGQTAANLGLEQTRAGIAVQAARAVLQDAKNQLENASNQDAVTKARSAVAAAERELQSKLRDERLIKDKVKSRKQRLTGRAADQKWAKVNQRALKLNQKSDLGTLKTKEEKEAEAAIAAVPKFNPYARRKVKPKILWEVGQKEEKKDDETMKDSAADGSKDDKKQQQQQQDLALSAATSLVQDQHKAAAAALSQSHQFTIDEETLLKKKAAGGVGGGVGTFSSFSALSGIGNGSLMGENGSKQVNGTVKRVRKGLSLAEYQERKTAGTL